MTLLAEIAVFIEYAQILVIRKDHPAPGLLWTDEHAAQGFAWSDGVVSFGVPGQDGESLIQIEHGSYHGPSAESSWAIQLPFGAFGPVEIGTVFDKKKMSIPPQVITISSLKHSTGTKDFQAFTK